MLGQRCANGQKTVIASFQSNLDSSSDPSENVWLEILNEILPSKEFTICHWINIKFFNRGIAACLWSYCIVENKDDPMECLQLCLQGVLDTVNRNLQFEIRIPSRKGEPEYRAFVPLKYFHHRTWNHLCWSLSTITGYSRLYHNGDLIDSQRISTNDIDLAMKGSSKMHAASFIFGQEPDSIRGGFDIYQAFIGDLTEFNAWNNTLSAPKIYDMSTCKSLKKGNVVPWDLNHGVTDEKFVFHNVTITTFPHSSELCNIMHRFVIFPERVQYPEAKDTCKIHGGSLAIPHSENENKILMSIVKMHEHACIARKGPAIDKLVWIGAEQVDGNWQEVSRGSHHWSNISSQYHLNFTNFLRISSRSNTDCTYLRKDGFWIEGDYHLCKWYLYLCTICVIYRQPIFTIKGVCDTAPLGWNHYPIINSKNQIEIYEGYKMYSKIIFDKKLQKWKIMQISKKEVKVALYISNFGGKYPIGRKKWSMKETECGINPSVRSLALSACDFPLQFTCDSGDCVDIEKRCDGRKDCKDGSDEYLCSLVNVPSFYDNGIAPERRNGESGMDIHIDARIIKIDSIDTINMMVALTMELSLIWHDGALSFFNPSYHQDNILHYQKSKQLWTPIRNLIHENAIVGNVIEERREIKILPISPEPLAPSAAIENEIFNGSHNPLKLTQRMKINYDCRFDVKKFPFDDQNCSFIMKINQQKMTTIRLISNHNAVYKGETMVDQFAIAEIYSSTENTNKSTRYTINIHMIRNFTNQVLNTFILTLILWLFGYSTLLIDMSDFGSRFIGAGTSLLVIATQFAAISEDLPKSSYMKLIDIWFLWHNISILVIIIYHILIDKLNRYLDAMENNDLTPFESTDEIGSTKLELIKVLHQGNNIVIMAFPFLNGLFYAIYFHFTLN